MKFDVEKRYAMVTGKDYVINVLGQWIIDDLNSGKYNSALMVANGMVVMSTDKRTKEHAENIKQMFGFVEISHLDNVGLE